MPGDKTFLEHLERHYANQRDNTCGTASTASLTILHYWPPLLTACVLGYDKCQKRYGGGPSIVGRTINLNE